MRKKRIDIPPIIDEGTSYTHVLAGNGRTVLLRSDGCVVAWGQNDDRQCNIPLPEPGTFYIGDQILPVLPGRNLVLQLNSVCENDAVMLRCSNLAGEEMLHFNVSDSEPAWATLTSRIVRELKINLQNLQVVLPDGELLTSFSRANPEATIADLRAKLFDSPAALSVGMQFITFKSNNAIFCFQRQKK